MNERVLKRLKEYLDFPDGKFTDEHIVKTYEGSSIEGQIKLSIAFQDLGVALEDLRKAADRMFSSWKDNNQSTSK